MAYYIDYGKCYSGNLKNIGKSNKIDDGIVAFCDYDFLASEIYCSNCMIEQYLVDYENLIFDRNNQPQLFRVMYQNFEYNGMVLQSLKLEPVAIVSDNTVYTNDMNIITGINEDYKDTTKIVNIPYKIKAYTINEIGESFVDGNNMIEKIILPFTINKIGNRAFAYTQGIKSKLVLPEGLEVIGDQAFNASNIYGDLIIPEGIIEIGYYAFGSCDKLDGTLIIPSTFKFPETHYMFNGCRNLSKIIIYSDEIQTTQNINDFDDTGNCPIYVLDEMLDKFKSKMPNHVDRLFAFSEMYD